jgi:hypothetical protein
MRVTLVVIGIFQLVLGILFLAVPGTAADLTFRQVSTASFAPLVFIAGMLWFHPRRRTVAA